MKVLNEISRFEDLVDTPDTEVGENKQLAQHW